MGSGHSSDGLKPLHASGSDGCVPIGARLEECLVSDAALEQVSGAPSYEPRYQSELMSEGMGLFRIHIPRIGLIIDFRQCSRIEIFPFTEFQQIIP